MKNHILMLLIGLIIMPAFLLQAKQMECIVTVVDTQGRPIRGAEVSVWEQDFDWFGGGVTTKQLIDPKRIDVDGNAQIAFFAKKPDHSIIILARKAGFSVGWDNASQKARITEIRIVLDRINATAGIVTDEENQPIAGAKVTAYPVNEQMVEGHLAHLRWPDTTLLTTKTDHEGRFSFDCLAEWMEVSFTVEYPGRAYRDTTYDIEGNQLPLYKAGQKDIHITMYPAGGIKGRILTKRGNRIDGIKLVAQGERIRNGKRYLSVSDPEGYFTFEDLPPDSYFITILLAKDDPAQQLATGALAEVEVGETVDNIKIRMRDPIQLDVMVKDVKTEKPVPNATVWVQQRRVSEIFPHVYLELTSDSRGIARILTLPGKCRMGASCDNYDGSFGEYLVRSTDTHFLLGLKPYSVISGKVVDENGRPSAGVEVRVSTFKTERKLTDRNGRFRLKFSEQRAQRGFVIARDMKTGRAGIVDITEHEGPVKVVLKPAATLKGCVVDPDDQPIKMAKVQISYIIPHAMTRFVNDLYTDENGEFEIFSVPYAQEHFGYRVSASAYGYSLTRYEKIDVNKDMGDVIKLPPIILKPRNMTLSGKAVYPDGTVAAYKQVHLNDVQNMHGQPILHSVTDADGKFHFEGACEGWLRIQCGSVIQKDFGFLYAKGGDRVTLIMNNNNRSSQMHRISESFEGVKLPMYESLVKGMEIEKLENRKLLICFWESHEEKSQAVIKELAEIAEQLGNADISVILLNGGRGYSGKYAAVNIGNDRKWLDGNKVPFRPVYIEKTEDLLELRRAVGAKFLSHMVLTDKNKVVTHEGFDVQWLKDNVLEKEAQ